MAIKNPWETGGLFRKSDQALLEASKTKLFEGIKAWTDGTGTWKSNGDLARSEVALDDGGDPLVFPGPKTTDWDNVFIKDRKGIVIVLDPGHSPGTCGKREVYGEAGATGIVSYKHYKRLEDANGNPIPDGNGNAQIATTGTGDAKKNETTITSLADMTLPKNKYLKDDLNNGISSRKWIITTNYSNDSSDFERTIVYDISEHLYSLLSPHYTVVRTKTEGAEQCIKLSERSKIAKDNNAHYFISLHINSDPFGNFQSRGYHVLYRSLAKDEDAYNERQIEFARDILSLYTLIPVDAGHYPTGINDDGRPNGRNLAVLKNTSNPAHRKALLELGYLGNPEDTAVLKGQKQEIARQIARSLEVNIMKHYFTPGEIKKWMYKGVEYDSPDLIRYPSREKWERQEAVFPPYPKMTYYPEAQEILDTEHIFEQIPLPAINF